MHDVAVALDDELIRHLDRADLGDAPDVVAAEVEQHQVLGPLLGIARAAPPRAPCPRPRSAPRRVRAGDRPDGHLAVAHAHQDLRARADEREVAEVEMEQERRRVEAAQRAVERERRQRERRREALRQHDLEDVAGADVLLRPLDHGEILARARVRARLRLRELASGERSGMRERRLERGDRRLEPLQRSLVGLLGADLRLRPHRRDEADLVLHGVEDDDQRRAHQHAVGHAEVVRLRFGRCSIRRTVS